MLACMHACPRAPAAPCSAWPLRRRRHPARAPWRRPPRTLQGPTHKGLVVALYGMAILVAGNFLMMALGDAL